MFDHVQFTGTINLGAISTAIVTLLGIWVVYWRGKVSEQKTRRIIQEENRKTRECIHAIPGHPEGRPTHARTRKSDRISKPAVEPELPAPGD